LSTWWSQVLEVVVMVMVLALEQASELELASGLRCSL
jgi:hypothetical protein